LSEEQKTEFPDAQKDAAKILTECIQGKREIEDLLPEESFVLGKLIEAYEEFKEKNPDKPFSFELAKDIDCRVYHNLAQRLSFRALEDKGKTSDQEKLNSIREKLGLPTQEIQKNRPLLPEEKVEPKPLTTEEVKEIERNAYAKVKQGQGNLDLMINFIDWEIGQRFDAHGLAKKSVPAQLWQLLNLIEKGIDPDRPFHTAPLEVDPELRAGLGTGLGTGGGTTYKDGSFIILGEIDQKINQSGIRYIAVNDAYYDSISRLQEAYPQVQFIRADELNDILKKIAEKK